MNLLAKAMLVLPSFGSLTGSLTGTLHAQEPAAELDTRGLVLNAEGACSGYKLIATLTNKGEVLLIDRTGEVVHWWETGSPTESAILLDDGDLLRWGVTTEENPRFQGPGVDGGVVERLEWDGDVVWRYVLDDDERLLHHDIALLPNGNVLFLSWEHVAREEALAAGRDPAHVGEAGMWPDAVFEIAPTPPAGGEIVWEWHAWDHLVQDYDKSLRNYGSVPDFAGRIDLNADHRDRPPLSLAEIAAQEAIEAEMAALGYGGGDDEDEDEDEQDESGPARRPSSPDWLHTNAIDHLPEHDLIVLSSPALSELWIIDHSTTTAEAAGSSGGRRGRGGELLWRWGNPRNYGAGSDADQALWFQHDPTWLPSANPNELRLLVFNNGRGRLPEPYSSADELVLPFDPERGFPREPGKPFGPDAAVWSYSEPGVFYSSFISGAGRLPNGNTLICSGAQGRVFEVTPDGQVVWDFRNPYVGDNDFGIPANALYRAVHIPEDHPGVAGL